jgi:hypothetical protein
MSLLKGLEIVLSWKGKFPVSDGISRIQKSRQAAMSPSGCLLQVPQVSS